MWDRGNLQGLCLSCHSIKTAEDRRGGRVSASCPHGYPVPVCRRCSGG